MTKYRIILTALALIFNITGAHCQKKYFRVENGLPSDFIVSMNVDENGTVWIGTEEGMCSFNGVDIKTFNSDLLGQPSNYVLPDRNDESIWVATQRSGFGCYDPVNDILRSYQTGNDSDNTGVGENNSKGITPPHDILTNEITYLCQDEEGNIWYSTYTKGMGKYNKADDSIEFFNSQTVEGMEDFSIISFAIDADYKIYAGHYNRGITIIDTKTKKATHLETSNSSTLPTNQIGYVLCDNDNNVWVGTSRGVALYRPVTNDFMVYNMANSGLPDNHIFSMYVTSDRRLLVSPNYNGVWYANIDELHDNPQFKPLPEAKDIMNLPVRGMAEDRFGNLWLGSYGRGVLFVGNTASDFKMISNENDAASSVSAFIELRDRGYAIGLVGGGIDILDSRLRKTTSLNKFLSNSTTTALTQDSSGNIWVGTFSGRIQLVDEKLRSSITIPILEARDFLEVGDTMWVASGLGLYSVNKRTNEIINRWSNVDNTLPDIYLRCLCMDCYGRLWVGSYRSGIMVFDKDMNLMTRIMTDEPSFSNQVNDLFYDGLFTVYAATGDGLVIYDISGDTIVEDRVIRKTDRISSNFIKSVTQDDNLGIWFSTNLSICRYDEIDGSVTEYKNHYGSDFSVGNFNGNVACIGKDGVLSFGSTEGLVRFEPIAVIDALQAPTVHFREISIINRGNKAGMGQVRQLDRDEDKKLKLAYQERSFSLLFATDDYSLSGLTNYICEIDGKELYQPSGANHIVFSDLAPGNHSISIKSRIGEAEYGPEDSLEINIRHSIFWNLFSQLFYLLCLIALAVMIMVRYKRHLAEENKLKLERKSIDQQKDVDNERLRFYTNITHELRTPLTLILGPIRDIAATELPQGIATKIQIINKNASRLMELVNQLLDFRKVETSNYELKLAHGDISMAVENVGRIFAESNVNKNITFVQNISKNVIGFFDQEILTVILNNLLSNAFKYTEKGEIALEMKEKDG